VSRSESTSAGTQRDLLERDRKAEHIRLALDRRMQLEASFFEDWVFEHVALPEIDREEIDVRTEFLGKGLDAPLLISCMTGGTEVASQINNNLAIAAERARVAVGVGSQRKAIEDPGQAPTFQVRDLAPTVPLLANLGAVQLNYGYGVSECEAAVEMIDADALALHLNALQEAIQPEGQCNFKGLLPKIEMLARQLSVPVIVKEVGCGISGTTGRELFDRGIRIIDTAGLGGTSWARIEASRSGDVEIGERFADWGVPTPESIRQLREIDGLTVIGSGGVRNGIDVAKAIALGADLVGMAFPLLEAAMDSPDKVVERIERTVQELEIGMFCLGALTIEELKRVKLHRRSER
jgi:isopentenyl-diphosphate delta-isomerase